MPCSIKYLDRLMKWPVSKPARRIFPSGRLSIPPSPCPSAIPNARSLAIRERKGLLSDRDFAPLGPTDCETVRPPPMSLRAPSVSHSPFDPPVTRVPLPCLKTTNSHRSAFMVSESSDLGRPIISPRRDIPCARGVVPDGTGRISRPMQQLLRNPLPSSCSTSRTFRRCARFSKKCGRTSPARR